MARGSKSYTEVRIKSLIDPGDLLEMLSETGVLGASEADYGFSLFWAPDRWAPDVLRELKGALVRLGDAEAAGSLAVLHLADQDWNARWAETVRPIRLSPRILIRQSWNRADVPEGGFDLIIDPKRAFGTGYHATTQLMVEWLDGAIAGGERVLDVGTGSGILAMAALRLGARSAVGIDLDPEAIECAAEYAAGNGFGPELELRAVALADFRGSAFDLVLANLDRNTLTRHIGDLGRLAGLRGRQVISGLLTEDEPDFRDIIKAAGWRLTNRRERDEWLMLELSRL